MRNDNVYYINLKPYVRVIPYEEMANRYYMKNPRKILNRDKWIDNVAMHMNRSNYHKLQYKENNSMLDNQIGKDALMHIQQFFKLHKPIESRGKNSQSKTRKRNT